MSPWNTPLPAQAKAVLAGTIAGLSALLPLMPDGFQWADAVTALVAALVAYGAVFQVPNATPDSEEGGDPGYRGRHRPPDTVLGTPGE